MLATIIRFFLENKLVTMILLLLCIGWGVATAPFAWDWSKNFPHDPVPVDAIPNLGENQQIVFTQWMGRSPQDMDDQITYPLTTALLGIPGVKTIRSSSMFGISSIYIIFEEDIDFYWSRSRILEKLNSLPSGTLPDGVQPTLGPDATALGQIYWYTLEGRDPQGNPTGGWDLHELRSIQDFTVKYALASAQGVSEVASIGGQVQEYQVDVDPAAMRVHQVTLPQIMQSIRNSNADVGAKTIEINRAEYLVRGIGFIKNTEDLEAAVVKVQDNVPIRIKDVAKVNLGPAPRRGVLDKGGAEVVGGVVVARYGANPLEVINNLKAQIEKVSQGLPKKTLADGTVSQVTIVPFYDRTKLIKETLGTLEEALSLEILITILVVMLMVMNLRASFLISSLLPVAVLMCFIAMRYTGIDANIVALSGIAIAIGTMVDMGIVLSENMLQHLREATSHESRLKAIQQATIEVAPAVLTAVATTIVSFLPVFTMEAAEGKLFKPLAFTKTYALMASIMVALFILPALSQWVLTYRFPKGSLRKVINGAAILLGGYLCFWVPWAGALFIAVGLGGLVTSYLHWLPEKWQGIGKFAGVLAVLLVIGWLLAKQWLPLGPEAGNALNFLFVALVIGFLLGAFQLFLRYYPYLLRWCLSNKVVFLIFPLLCCFWGYLSWKGADHTLGWLGDGWKNTKMHASIKARFPGLGNEFMPALGEGSFLLMPSSMPHAGMEDNIEVLQQLDMAVSAIPEVDMVVGKLGRVGSALDPAPVSMYENVINYKSEYRTDEDGHRLRFKVDGQGNYVLDPLGNLIEDPNGDYFRQWRDHIHSPDDIWEEIAKVQLPGVTTAPKLQPIETRLIMLQTGMRAPMGVKVKGPDLRTIEAFGMQLETHLKEVEGVKVASVFADRIVGKPYIEIYIDRQAIGRYGLSIQQVQSHIEAAIGGMAMTTTVEGRERYAVRLRYARELRDSPHKIEELLIPIQGGNHIPLKELATIGYVQGPQVIKSENTFLVGYVLFDKLDNYAEVDVVEAAQKHLQQKIDEGTLHVPAGVSYEFAGNYENQVRATNRLDLVKPLALLIIGLILYLQFRSVPVTLMILSAVVLAVCGGMILIWLYGQTWFMDFQFFGANMRDLFQMKTINMSVAVWVGFIALFGIATDDGVVMATYLKQVFQREAPKTRQAIRDAVVEAGKRRIRPCLMTTATTLLALLPILTATGRGADIMIPMAIPVFGGMALELITLFIIPVLYSLWEELKVKV